MVRGVTAIDCYNSRRRWDGAGTHEIMVTNANSLSCGVNMLRILGPHKRTWMFEATCMNFFKRITIDHEYHIHSLDVSKICIDQCTLSFMPNLKSLKISACCRNSTSYPEAWERFPRSLESLTITPRCYIHTNTAWCNKWGPRWENLTNLRELHIGRVSIINWNTLVDVHHWARLTSITIDEGFHPCLINLRHLKHLVINLCDIKDIRRMRDAFWSAEHWPNIQTLHAVDVNGGVWRLLKP